MNTIREDVYGAKVEKAVISEMELLHSEVKQVRAEMEAKDD